MGKICCTSAMEYHRFMIQAYKWMVGRERFIQLNIRCLCLYKRNDGTTDRAIVSVNKLLF